MNPWIAQQREQAFRSELNDRSVWIYVAAMLQSEGDPLQTCESFLNRVMYVRSHGKQETLLQMIKSGFYGPYNRGEYPKFIAQLRGSGKLVEQMNDAIEIAMSGSDTIEGYTDQGLPTDPNGDRQPQLRFSGNVYNDWDGGPGRHAGSEAWRQWFETSALQAALKQLVPACPVTISGAMDGLTVTALKVFQSENPECDGVDGDYGPKTRAAINKALSA